MGDFDIRPWLGHDALTSSHPGVDMFDVDDADQRALVVSMQHPELAAAIDRGVDEVMHNGEPMSPHLHLTMHEVVVNQLLADDPPAVRRAAERLVRQGHDHHEIMHMIATGVSTELWSALREQQPADIARYTEYLDGLPASWIAATEEPDVEPDMFDPGMPDDPTDDGPAAALVRAMLAEGVDLDDQNAIGAWLDDFNARPYDERDRILPDSLSDVAVPPLALPDDATLAAAALESSAMTQLVRFLEWIGDGRPLTDKGNLKRADGRQLIDLLGTADRFDETIGDRTFRTKSTTELPTVDLVYRLAVAARLARRHRGTVKRTRRGTALIRAAGGGDTDAAEVLEAWRTVVLEMVRMGLIRAGREDRYGMLWWAEVLEEDAVGLLCAVAIGGAALSVDRVAEGAHDNVVDEFDHVMTDTHRSYLPDAVAHGMGTLVDRLAWLGVATRDGVEVETDEWGYEHRRGGEVALTPLGSWFVRPVLIAQGIEVPMIGEHAGADADELLDAVVGWPPDAFEAEVRAWASARSDPSEDLAAAARHAYGLERPNLVFEALGVIGEEAVPVVRALGSDAVLRPFARLWLAERGYETPDSVATADEPAGVVHSLATLLVGGGHEALCDVARRGDVGTAQIDQLWRVDDPWTGLVLDALGGVPDKKVAKAARRALFKHRNRN